MVASCRIVPVPMLVSLIHSDNPVSGSGSGRREISPVTGGVGVRIRVDN